MNNSKSLSNTLLLLGVKGRKTKVLTSELAFPGEYDFTPSYTTDGLNFLKSAKERQVNAKLDSNTPRNSRKLR